MGQCAIPLSPGQGRCRCCNLHEALAVARAHSLSCTLSGETSAGSRVGPRPAGATRAAGRSPSPASFPWKQLKIPCGQDPQSTEWSHFLAHSLGLKSRYLQDQEEER